MKLIEKRKAIILRQEGRSIKEIAKTMDVAKSSVSMWVRNVPISKKQSEILKKNQHSTDVIEKRRATRLKNELAHREGKMTLAGRDISMVSKRELKLIGAMLYWAEGSKRRRHLSFSNSDPMIVKVIMRFFREICEVPDTKFRLHIHTYSHLNALSAEKFWSEITNISLRQFYKTYSKPSKASQGKMDALPYGTLDIFIGDVELFLKIMGWIAKISKLLVSEPKLAHLRPLC